MTPPPNPPQHPGALNELALFAGAGGGILGGHLLGWRTVCAVERDPYAAAILAARQNDGAFHPFPIWNDVCTFDGRPWRGRVDVVSGGFPCQDISVAGGGAGLSGERSGLWREFARIIREVGPRYVFVENSPALAFRGLDVVLGDLAAMGYDAEWGVLGADDVGAPHKRERMWIVGQVADAPDIGRQGLRRVMGDPAKVGTGRGGEDATTLCGPWIAGDPADRESGAQPFVGRVANGVAHRVDRLRAIGNGQVPLVAAVAWTELHRRLNA
jgi:DNA (cytosine-5)-methyltransferase 1